MLSIEENANINGIRFFPLDVNVCERLLSTSVTTCYYHIPSLSSVSSILF